MCIFFCFKINTDINFFTLSTRCAIFPLNNASFTQHFSTKYWTKLATGVKPNLSLQMTTSKLVSIPQPNISFKNRFSTSSHRSSDKIAVLSCNSGCVNETTHWFQLPQELGLVVLPKFFVVCGQTGIWSVF